MPKNKKRRGLAGKNKPKVGKVKKKKTLKQKPKVKKRKPKTTKAKRARIQRVKVVDNVKRVKRKRLRGKKLSSSRLRNGVSISTGATPTSFGASPMTVGSRGSRGEYGGRSTGGKSIQMTPQAKCALQAITSPFKATENCARIPDGRGGESFPTTDKLRKSENDQIWLQAIQHANTQWVTYSNQLCSNTLEAYIPYQGSAYSGVTGGRQNFPGYYSNEYQGETPQLGWNILACNCPVMPSLALSPMFPGPSSTDPAGKWVDPQTQTWKDIEINASYYFALPSTQIDAVMGSLGGPTNNIPMAPPKNSHRPAAISGPSEYGVLEASEVHPMTLDELASYDMARASTLREMYPANLSAPMQIYRILDFTFSLDGLEEVDMVQGTLPLPLSDLAAVLTATYPNMTPDELLKKVTEIEKALEDENDPTRYRCQVITPLAGVTQWKDFTLGQGLALYRNDDFFVYPDTNVSESDDDTISLKSYNSSRSRSKFKSENHNEYSKKDKRHPESEMKDVKDFKVGLEQYPVDVNYSQLGEMGDLPMLYVESDFTYADGHNGILSNDDVRQATMNVDAIYPDGGGHSPPDDWARHADSKSITTAISMSFKGSLVASRRIVGFGMKLFSTEAAMTADGRIVGGQLPLNLVAQLLGFQSITYQTAQKGSPTLVTNDWTPLNTEMDEWSGKIESRLQEYVAYRAVDGCTVRYNALQTREQARYVQTKAGQSITLTPTQVALMSPKGLYDGKSVTGISRIDLHTQQEYVPPSAGSEMVPVIIFKPAEPSTLNYGDLVSDPSAFEDGLFLQAVLHTENLSTNAFPLETADSIYDPNWELYSRICCEDENFPVATEGHSFRSFFSSVQNVVKTAMKFGAVAIDVGEVLLPLL